MLVMSGCKHSMIDRMLCYTCGEGVDAYPPDGRFSYLRSKNSRDMIMIARDHLDGYYWDNKRNISAAGQQALQEALNLLSRIANDIEVE